MNIHEFASRISEIISEKHGVKVSLTNAICQGGTALTGLYIDTGSGATAVVYADQLYQSFMDGSCDIDTAAECLYDAMVSVDPFPIQHKLLFDYDYVKPRLYMQACSPNANRGMADTISITQFGICFSPVVHINSSMQCKVSSSLVRQWGIPTQTLLHDVKTNMRESLTISNSMQGFSFNDMHIICTGMCQYGGAALLYPKILSELVSMIGLKRAFLLPSSVHELIALDPSYITAEDARRLVHDMNQSGIVYESDIMSDDIFLLDVDSQTLRVVR